VVNAIALGAVEGSMVDCAIAMVWPTGPQEPVCEMFLVDHRSGTWTSKHYVGGQVFMDGGRLRDGETARTLAELGTRSGIYRYVRSMPVRFVVADLDPEQFVSTHPTQWTLTEVAKLPGADVETISAH
jgi:hypothetical protein